MLNPIGITSAPSARKQLVTFAEMQDGLAADVAWSSMYVVRSEENPADRCSWNAMMDPGLELVSTDYRKKSYP
jgi:predicted secreted protein